MAGSQWGSWLGIVGAAALALLGGTAQAQFWKPGCKPCCPSPYCSPCVPAPAAEAPKTDPVEPKIDPAQPPAVEPSFTTEQAAAGSDYYAAAPNMIGDLFANTLSISFPYGNAAAPGRLELASLANLINAKVAENNSPLPMDRVAFRYNFFHNAASVDGPSDLVGQFGPNTLQYFVSNTTKNYDTHAFNFSVEKTFFNDLLSVELRVPFFSTLGAEQEISTIRTAPVFGGPLGVFPDGGHAFGDSDVAFGDLSIVLKGLLYFDGRVGLTGGLGVGVPTGGDSRVQILDGPSFSPSPVFRSRDFQISNDVWSLSPYLAALCQPNDRLFFQGFGQIYLPMGGNDLTYESNLNLAETGARSLLNFDQAQIDGQAILMLDVGVGYWLARNNSGQGLTGLAPTLELHYTTALEDADIITLPADSLRTPFGPQPPPQVGNLSNRFDFLNLTVGATAEFSNRLLIATGMVVPLRDGDDRFFDWEFQFQMNYRFGPAPDYLMPPL
jgi:hypothetical protein